MKLKVTSDRGEVQIHKITGREDKVEAAIIERLKAGLYRNGKHYRSGFGWTYELVK